MILNIPNYSFYTVLDMMLIKLIEIGKRYKKCVAGVLVSYWL